MEASDPVRGLNSYIVCLCTRMRIAGAAALATPHMQNTHTHMVAGTKGSLFSLPGSSPPSWLDPNQAKITQRGAKWVL